MPACLATSVALAPGSISAATHPSFSERDHRRRLSTEVMTSIRFMALWLSLVLATLSYAAPPRAQGGAFRMDTVGLNQPRVLSRPPISGSHRRFTLSRGRDRNRAIVLKNSDFRGDSIWCGR